MHTTPSFVKKTIYWKVKNNSISNHILAIAITYNVNIRYSIIIVFLVGAIQDNDKKTSELINNIVESLDFGLNSMKKVSYK